MLQGETNDSPIRRHSKSMYTVAIRYDGKLIVSSSPDKTVQDWRKSTGEAFREPFPVHNSYLYAVAITESRNCIASCSGDGNARLCDALNGDPIRLPLQGDAVLANLFCLVPRISQQYYEMFQNKIVNGHQ